MTSSLSPIGGIPDGIHIPEITSESPQSLPGLSDQISIAGDQNSVTESNMLPTMQPPSVDLDFDLMWPDSEDLFETLMATEMNTQWQMPLSTLPISSRSLYTSTATFGTPNSFQDQAQPIDNIPSGESHQAVHNVSNMVTSLVSFPHGGVMQRRVDNSSLRQLRQQWKLRR